jgi:hypothetical protein
MVDGPQATKRLERAQRTRLLWAFVISLLLHAGSYGTYHYGKQLGWWRTLRLPSWMMPTKTLAQLFQKESKVKPPEPEVEVPLMFVDVSPQQASPEPPKPSAFYSDKNSKAANPDPAPVDKEMPKIDGRQTDIVKTEDVPRQKMFPLQPAIPAQPSPEPQEEVKPKSAEAPGDLAMAKPSDKPQKETITKEEKPPQPPKPKTIEEAKARLATNQERPGQKMLQDGGVRQRAMRSSLDVTATSFGAYDAAIISAVQNRWDDLLENRLYARDRFGKVTVRFHLHANGTVTEMTFVENTVDLSLALLCQSAIRDSAPYAEWPADMRRKIGAEFREVTFTFYYN